MLDDGTSEMWAISAAVAHVWSKIPTRRNILKCRSKNDGRAKASSTEIKIENAKKGHKLLSTNNAQKHDELEHLINQLKEILFALQNHDTT